MRTSITRVRWPVAPHGAAARGTWPERAALIVTVRTGAAIGFGEAAPLPGFGADTLDAAEADLRAWAADPQRRLTIASPSARYAIDSALCRWTDLRQRAASAALRSRVVIDDDRDAAAAMAAGAPGLKVKLTGHGDRARLAAIRAAAPRARLTADCNQTWPVAEVDDRLAELVEFALEYLEEPAPALAPLLTSPRAIPLALDESLADPARATWLPTALASGALAALIVKPTVLGVHEVMALLARDAHRAGVAVVVSHALDGPIALTAHRALAPGLGPTTLHGLAPHAALDAWLPLTAGAGVTDDDPARVMAAIERLAVPT